MAWYDYTPIGAGYNYVKDNLAGAMEWGKEKPDPANAQLQDAGFLRSYIQGQLGTVGGRQAPTAQAAQINMRPQNQFRTQEMGLAQQLAGVASGQQMGAGELATRRQAQQGLAQQLAMQSAQRGGMAGLAGRSAARNLGTMSTNAAGMAREAALQDQSAARGQLAGVLGQGRAADIGLATQQAGMQQQATLANQAARLQQMGMNDAAIAQMLGQMYNISAAEMQARIAQEQAAMGQQGYLPGLLQAGGQIGGALAMSSDIRLKTDIQPGGDAVDEFLDAIEPALFRYLDHADGDGQYAGVMAQDAEESQIGREMVIDTARGKMLDGRKTMSALLASVARLNERVRVLEAKG